MSRHDEGPEPHIASSVYKTLTDKALILEEQQDTRHI